jgi:hypothetical protein
MLAPLKARLDALKSAIIDGCKKAVAAFKEKGPSVLNNLASFFGLKNNLEDWKNDINKIIKRDDAAIAKIETFSAEYHMAGRNIKNMARVAVGKKPIDAAKEAGKLAKTLAAPYKGQRTALKGVRNLVVTVIAKLEQLDTAAEKAMANSAEKKPSLIKDLEDKKRRVELKKRETPTQEYVRTAAAEV